MRTGPASLCPPPPRARCKKQTTGRQTVRRSCLSTSAQVRDGHDLVRSLRPSNQNSLRVPRAERLRPSSQSRSSVERARPPHAPVKVKAMNSGMWITKGLRRAPSDRTSQPDLLHCLPHMPIRVTDCPPPYSTRDNRACKLLGSRLPPHVELQLHLCLSCPSLSMPSRRGEDDAFLFGVFVSRLGL